MNYKLLIPDNPVFLFHIFWFNYLIKICSTKKKGKKKKKRNYEYCRIIIIITFYISHDITSLHQNTYRSPKIPYT